MPDLLADDGVVGFGGESTFQSEMGGVSSHQFDEIPVFGVRRGIDHEVGDER